MIDAKERVDKWSHMSGEAFVPRKLQSFFFFPRNNSSVKIKNRTLFAFLPLYMHSTTLPKLCSYYHIWDVFRPFNSCLTSCQGDSLSSEVKCTPSARVQGRRQLTTQVSLFYHKWGPRLFLFCPFWDSNQFFFPFSSSLLSTYLFLPFLLCPHLPPNLLFISVSPWLSPSVFCPYSFYG